MTCLHNDSSIGMCVCVCVHYFFIVSWIDGWMDGCLIECAIHVTQCVISWFLSDIRQILGHVFKIKR